MRPFLVFLGIVALVVIVLVAVGVIRFSASDEELNISVDRTKIEQSAERAADETGRALENAGQKIREGASSATESTPNR